jgi:glutathione S-transferase
MFSKHNFKLYVDSRFLSPYALSAFVTLTEKGVPFEMRTVDLSIQENQSSGYATSSLTCRVPMLVHNGFYLSESSAISEYLEECLPPETYNPVYPRDIQKRATARQIQAWLRSDLEPLRNERPTEAVFLKPAIKPLSRAAQSAANKLFTAVDSLLKDNASHLFDQWCIADTDLALMLNRLVLSGGEVPERLAAYARHQWQRPSVQLWLSQERS